MTSLKSSDPNVPVGLRRTGDAGSLRSRFSIRSVISDPLLEVSPHPIDDLVGTTIGEEGMYSIKKVIGRGGMGVVYLAVREGTSEETAVAIKVLSGKSILDPTTTGRFMREVLTTARVDHKNVVKILDAGISDEGRLFYVMELLKGKNLCDKWEEGWDPTKDKESSHQLISIMCQVCDGLGAAHEKGVIHKDMKPENIMILDRTNQVKIIDLGIATLLSAGSKRKSTAGTILYMAPETMEGKEGDCRTDIYSLGVMLYALLAGKFPFEGSTAMDIIDAHMSAKPAAPSKVANTVDRKKLKRIQEFDELVLKALAKEPDNRHENIVEFKADLLKCAERLRLGFKEYHPNLGTIRTTILPEGFDYTPKVRRSWIGRTAVIVASALIGGVAAIGVNYGKQKLPTLEAPAPIVETGNNEEMPYKIKITTAPTDTAIYIERINEEGRRWFELIKPKSLPVLQNIKFTGKQTLKIVYGEHENKPMFIEVDEKHNEIEGLKFMSSQIEAN